MALVIPKKSVLIVEVLKMVPVRMDMEYVA